MENDKRFAALALTLKYDGLKLLCMIRLCPLPYSICNGAVSTFPTVQPLMYGLATAIITPKLLVPAFVGSRLRLLSEKGEEMSAGSKAVNIISILVTIGIGIFTGWYIYQRSAFLLPDSHLCVGEPGYANLRTFTYTGLWLERKNLKPKSGTRSGNLSVPITKHIILTAGLQMMPTPTSPRSRSHATRKSASDSTIWMTTTLICIWTMTVTMISQADGRTRHGGHTMTSSQIMTRMSMQTRVRTRPLACTTIPDAIIDRQEFNPVDEACSRPCVYTSSGHPVLPCDSIPAFTT